MLENPLPIDILEEYIVKLAKDEDQNKIKAIFFLKKTLFLILDKTSNTESAILRLKWWYDKISNSHTKPLESHDEDSEILQNYLKSLSKRDVENLCKFVESLEPMMGRRVLNSIQDEYLANYSNSLYNVIGSYLDCDKEAINLYAITEFLDNIPRIVKNGWLFYNNHEHFLAQLSELFLISHNYSSINRFLHSSCKYLISNYEKDNIAKTKQFPTFNIGWIKLRLTLYWLFS